MPYGFNEDKSRYDLQTDLDRITDLEEMISGEGESVDGIRARLAAVENGLVGLTAPEDLDNNMFWATPASGTGNPLWRGLVLADIPDIPPSKISGTIPMSKLAAIPGTKVTGLGVMKSYNLNGAGSGYTTTAVPKGDTFKVIATSRSERLDAGVWIVIGRAKWPSVFGGYREIALETNGSAVDGSNNARLTHDVLWIPDQDHGFSSYITQTVIRLLAESSPFTVQLHARQNTFTAISGVAGKIDAIRIR